MSWANTALVERAGTSADFVTAACMTYLPHKRLLRWAYAGHPPARRTPDGAELVAPSQGIPNNDTFLGLAGVTAVISKLQTGSASEAVTALRARVAEFADDSTLTDDLCIHAAHID